MFTPIKNLKNPRLDSLEMSPIDMISKMTNGNPGAMNVLMQVMKKDFMLVIRMDSISLYDHHIWEVYKDECKENIDKFIEKVKSY